MLLCSFHLIPACFTSGENAYSEGYTRSLGFGSIEEHKARLVSLFPKVDLSLRIPWARLPKYKHKREDRNILIYTMQAVSRDKRSLKRGIIKPSMLPIAVKTKQN